jgi:Ser/Thr protein kinase RdoA (MazF antagonist)
VSHSGAFQLEVDAAAAAAAEAAVRLGLSGRPTLLRSGAHHVLRVDDGVLRVAVNDRDARAQVALVRLLAREGLPVPRPLSEPVTIRGLCVTAWEHLDTRRPVDYRRLGAAISVLHELPRCTFVDVVRLPWCADAPWLQLEDNLESAARASVVTDDDIRVLRRAVDDVKNWGDAARSEASVVCHGDLHPLNLAMRGDQTVILDWDAICLGPAAWDHAALLTWAERWGGHPADYANFAAGYGLDFRGSELAALLARVRLLAPTINMITAGASSTRLAAEARLRMRYWHGERGALRWNPQ